MRKLFLLSVYSLLLPFLGYASCIKGNCVNGNGTMVLRNGASYTGNFSNGKAHGNGTLKHPDNSVYTGNFSFGVKSGIGTLKYATGELYVGNFENDVISGYGIITYKNGDQYEGSWVNARSSGKGIYRFADGDSYEGDFLDGEFTGTGKFLMKDGTYCEGGWYRNKKHGKMLFSNKNGMRYQYYDMGNPVSEQTFFKNHMQSMPMATDDHQISSNTVTTDCNLKNCHLVEGYYRYGDGSIYTGWFINGQGEGKGTCTYANGNRYEGGWKNHAPHGQGTLYLSSGNTYSAIWDNGRPIKKINDIIKTQSSNNATLSETNTSTNNGDIKVYAFIVGVATYQHMPSLKYTDDDAYQLYAFLKSPEGGAIPDHQIKVLIDEGATYLSIKKELHYISSLADANDVVLIYLSGHGIDGAYVPSDFDGYKNHIVYDEILTELNASKAKHKLFITDACHAGSMLATARTPMKISLENFYNAYNKAVSGTAILMSSKKDEVSLEYGGLRQGVFSHFLIKGLKGMADVNNDKLITINELYIYLSSQVKSYTNFAQTPTITGNYDMDMPVAMIR